MKLLFVCTGNTCRSCMAEAIAKNIAENRGIDIEISSAGIHAFAGDGASVNAVKVMEEMGIDVACHIAKPVSKELIEDNDLILTMTKSHKDTLIFLYPSAKDKIFTLMEYAGKDGDIVDPFGGDVNVYRSCAEQLKNLIEEMFDKIKES